MTGQANAPAPAPPLSAHASASPVPAKVTGFRLTGSCNAVRHSVHRTCSCLRILAAHSCSHGSNRSVSSLSFHSYHGPDWIVCQSYVRRGFAEHNEPTKVPATPAPDTGAAAREAALQSKRDALLQDMSSLPGVFLVDDDPDLDEHPESEESAADALGTLS